MSTVSTSFTATGNSTNLRLRPGESANYSVSGTFVGTVQVQRDAAGGNSNFGATPGIADITAAASGTIRNDTFESQNYRIACTAYTSGTIVTSLADVNTDVIQGPGGPAIWQDRDGNTVFKITEGGPISSSNVVAAGSTLTLTKETHANKTILLDTITGSVVTLPAALGLGTKYRFVISAKATSNSHKIQVANATDIMAGGIQTISDDTAGAGKGWIAGATDDTITLNRTTTGSVMVGEWFEIEDIASGVWAVRGVTASSGTEATPFSAAV